MSKNIRNIVKSVSICLVGIILLTACSDAASSSTEETGQSYADQLRGAVINPPRVLSDFSIPSTSGSDFTLSEHQGEVILLYFGYRSCPDVCPTTFAELIRVYRGLDEPVDRVKIIFVTIDPERDTIENLTLYTQAFHKDFIGLRAEGEPLESLLKQFGATARRQQLGDSALTYLMDHTASVFLIGPDGRLQSQYLYGTSYQDILHDVQIVLDANETQ
jgi:protein SCO1/2